jgi:hypothetical protein
MTNQNLKPCPFCGGDDTFWWVNESEGLIVVECMGGDHSRSVSIIDTINQGGTRADGWIGVDERLPKKAGRYWCCIEDLDHQWSYYFNGSCFLLPDGGSPTHWQPLPQAPGAAK